MQKRIARRATPRDNALHLVLRLGEDKLLATQLWKRWIVSKGAPKENQACVSR
jgi:hypothetical protein